MGTSCATSSARSILEINCDLSPCRTDSLARATARHAIRGSRDADSISSASLAGPAALSRATTGRARLSRARARQCPVCDPGSQRQRNGAGGGTRTPTGLPPTDFRTSYGFRRPVLARRRRMSLWSGLSLHRSEPRLRCCPSSLYTFSRQNFCRELGSGLPRPRFPRVWAVLRPRFPEAHSKLLQVRCVYRSATPA